MLVIYSLAQSSPKSIKLGLFDAFLHEMKESDKAGTLFLSDSFMQKTYRISLILLIFEVIVLNCIITIMLM